jgi:fructose-bisphosphate aldolase class I
MAGGPSNKTVFTKALNLGFFNMLMMASARLNAMNAGFKSRLPWALEFSFARAIQQPALEIWQGKEANVSGAQKALLHRARCNRAARGGEYNGAMETTSTTIP